jgi:hypothetical protein
MSHCLKYRRAKPQATFSDNLAAHCFPFRHGKQAVISDLGSGAIYTGRNEEIADGREERNEML